MKKIIDAYIIYDDQKYQIMCAIVVNDMTRYNKRDERTDRKVTKFGRTSENNGYDIHDKRFSVVKGDAAEEVSKQIIEFRKHLQS